MKAAKTGKRKKPESEKTAKTAKTAKKAKTAKTAKTGKRRKQEPAVCPFSRFLVFFLFGHHPAGPRRAIEVLRTHSPPPPNNKKKQQNAVSFWFPLATKLKTGSTERSTPPYQSSKFLSTAPILRLSCRWRVTLPDSWRVGASPTGLQGRGVQA